MVGLAGTVMLQLPSGGGLPPPESVGVGVGLIFLAREGLSYAMLRDLEEPDEADPEEPERERDRPRAGVSG